MHVQMIDVDDVGGFGKSFVQVAVLEDAAPDSVGPHGFVKDGLIGGGELGIDDGRQRLVFHAHQFGGVFGDGSGFGDDGGNRLSLIAGAIDRHGIVEDAIAGSGTDLEERID